MRIKLLQDSSALRGIAGIVAVSALALGLAGCEVAPPPRPAPPPAYAGPPPPNTMVYAYPEQGQSPDQQSKDRYECSLWAVQQTGFDPSAPSVPPEDRVVASAPPPSHTGAAVGAIAGAVIGAAISPRWDRGAGAVFGGLTGAVIGNASDAQHYQQNQMQMTAQEQQQYAAMAQKASQYRRALAACLSGRGYSVK